MPFYRCTVSHHLVTLGDGHLDIFFETEGDYLETYETNAESFQDLILGKKILCNKKKPHRNLYLDYEGEISNGRGILRVLWKGTYWRETSIFPEAMKIFLFNNKNLKLEF